MQNRFRIEANTEADYEFLKDRKDDEDGCC